MSRKPKFKPEVIRIALNPEQAVLTCSCYNTNKEYPVTRTKFKPFLAVNACNLLASKTIAEGSACASTGVSVGIGDVDIKEAQS